MTEGAMTTRYQPGNASFLTLPHKCFFCGTSGVVLTTTSKGPICGSCIDVLATRAVEELANAGTWNADAYQVTMSFAAPMLVAIPLARRAADALFLEFWESYPYRMSGGKMTKPGKMQAWKAFLKALKHMPGEQIIAAVKAYPFEFDRPQFIQGPSVWLNQGNYMADVDHTSQTTGSSAELDRMHAELARTIEHE